MALFAAGVWAGDPHRAVLRRHRSGADRARRSGRHADHARVHSRRLERGARRASSCFASSTSSSRYPASKLEKLHGGLGVMADDAMAAIYANLSLRVLMWLLPALDRVTAGARRPLRTAEVIAVGSELLGSTRVDTNSLFLAERLSSIGIELRAKAVVGDNRARGRGAAARRARRASTCRDPHRRPRADRRRRDARRRRGRARRAADRGRRRSSSACGSASSGAASSMPEVNRRQAMVLEGGTVLANPNGTAPGQMFERAGQVVICCCRGRRAS